MTRLQSMRARAARVLLIALGAGLVLFVAAALFIEPGKALIGGGLVAAAAGLAFAAWRTDADGWTARAAIASALIAIPVAFTYLMSERAWQIDMHMVFFAALAAVTVMCDWRADAPGCSGAPPWPPASVS